MHIHLIAVGKRMPQWVTTGYDEYARRMPRHCDLRLVEITAGHRGKNADIERINRDEGERLLAAIPTGARVIALERRGRSKSTEDLAAALDRGMQDGQDIALLIGGPEGLSKACQQRADEIWSLSSMTMAHPIVRVVLAEQLYRAWSIHAGLPYHRGNE
jgi:23S rRNA (pseudouridine1915-N3)-methyltransferase